MLIPKLNKFQAIPKKKYRVISEDPQTCVKPFPWKPGVKKTSLENAIGKPTLDGLQE